jgi:hypothetical protein
MDACSLQKTLLGNRCNTARYTFELSEESELQFPSSGLSQGLESHHLSESVGTDDDELRLLEPQEVTPDTSVTQVSEQAKFKRPKKR